MSLDPLPDHILDYINSALDAADHDDPAPDHGVLTPAELELAQDLLSSIRAYDVDSVELVPLTEDPVAIRLGLAAPAPPVVISPETVAAKLASQDLAELEGMLVHYGHTVDREWLRELSDGCISEMSPMILRTLAALLDSEPGELARDDIEPYPADHQLALVDQLAEPWYTEIHGDEVHIANNDHRLGVLVAHVASIDRLDALNVRRAAWELLTSRWIRHSACLIVSPADGFAAVVIDAVDCQPHQRAPSGVLTYGPITVRNHILDALNEYQARYQVSWQPPARISSDTLTDHLIPPTATTGIEALLTGSYAEPKRTAFTAVRDHVKDLPASAWEVFACLDDPDDLDGVDVTLEAFLTS